MSLELPLLKMEEQQGVARFRLHKYSDLQIALDRSSGQIGTDVDFVATATVVDPDNSSSVFSYIWSCTQSGSTCLDSSQNNLLIGQTSRILTISKSKLSNSAVYYLTLTVSTLPKQQAYLCKLQ